MPIYAPEIIIECDHCGKSQSVAPTEFATGNLFSCGLDFEDVPEGWTAEDEYNIECDECSE